MYNLNGDIVLDNFHKIINGICIKNNIETKFVSKDWVIILKKDNKIRFITGCKFPLNDHALGEVIDDKYALYDVLKYFNIPVCEHHILYSDDNKNKYALDANNKKLVYDYFEKYKHIVLKTNIGTCGHDVYKIDNKNDIEKTLNNLFSKYTSISYCPYYNIINEYRVIVLNKKIKLMYKKIKPVVIGDGIKTIKELLIGFNSSYFENKLKDDKYNRILNKDEKYEYNWKFNLSQGAIASFDIDKTIKENIIKLVNKIIDTINVKFVSIDIIKTKDELLVLEINSGIMMENIINMVHDKKIVYDIYEEAIKEMFK